MTTWSDLTTALKRLQTPLLKVIKGRISFKWMGEQESDTPLSSNERVPLLEARHTLDEKCKLQTCLLWEFDYEYCLKYKLNTCYFLNAHFKRLVNSIPKNNSVLEMLPTNCQYPWMPKALLCLSGAILHLEEDPSISKGRDIWSLSAHKKIHSDCVHLGLLCLLLFHYCKSIGLNSRDKLHNNLLL